MIRVCVHTFIVVKLVRFVFWVSFESLQYRLWFITHTATYNIVITDMAHLLRRLLLK